MSNLIKTCVCGEISCEIPFGTCHCGCGGKTTPWERNNTKVGGVRGEPRKFIATHQWRPSQVVDCRPFKIEGVYCRLLPLTQGLYVIVDEVDYRWLMCWRWFASFNVNTRSFYALRKDKRTGKTLSMQRFILGLEGDDERTADHINGNTLDNRRKNLRVVSGNQSAQNRGMRCDNKTGFKGVYFRKTTGKYVAQIRANKETYHLGEWTSPEDAHRAYCLAAEKYHGDYRRA